MKCVKKVLLHRFLCVVPKVRLGGIFSLSLIFSAWFLQESRTTIFFQDTKGWKVVNRTEFGIHMM